MKTANSLLPPTTTHVYRLWYVWWQLLKLPLYFLFWMCIGFLIICIFVCLFEFVVRLSKLLPSLLFEFPPSSRLARSISGIQIEDSKNSFSSLKVYSAHMARAMKTYILMRWQQKMYHPHKHSTPHAHRCIRVLCKNAGW